MSEAHPDDRAWGLPPLAQMPTPTDAASLLDDATAPAGEPAPAPVTRRAALRVLGAVPLAGAALAAPAWAQPPVGQAPRQPHATPNQPANTPQGGTPPRSAAARRFLTAHEHRTASVLADDLPPRDARSGSATEAGVPAYLDYHLSLPETDEATRVAVRGGLRWLDTETRRRHDRPYAAVSARERHAVLDDIAWPERARPELAQGAAFLTRFRDMVASGFFSSRMGWEDLRYQGNVFNPDWQGCPEPAMRKLGVTPAVMNTRVPPRPAR
ncbi:MAG TPA: gluconate 2-dehydrogenase subunit 3 family protein [Gemmatirosa sp.]|nr:gluconate 2-dehydrogenase subunit 3 family protein [Gemmatirosa sp.]